jgi:hypothetical protein
MPRAATRKPGFPYPAGMVSDLGASKGRMMSDGNISEEALSRLARQFTALEVLPFLATDRKDTALTHAFADSCNVDDPIDLIRQFSGCVRDGVIPPPGILIAIAAKFQGYLDANGDSPMDFFFFGERKQGKKEKLKQALKDEEKNKIYCHMWDLMKRARADGKPITILAAAGMAIDDLKLSIARDSLEKNYIASGIGKILDNADKIIEEMRDK